MNLIARWLTCAAGLFLPMAAAAHSTLLELDTSREVAQVRPTMYGVFFEDINFGADGGLYAEMVKNRSFEFPQNLMGWESFGNVKLMDDGPFGRNPHYVRLAAPSHGHKRTGLENEGFLGMGFRQGERYRFSVWARTVGGNAAKVLLSVQLVDSEMKDGRQICATETVEVVSDEWRKYTVYLTPDATVARGHLRVSLVKPDGSTGVDLEHLSLFPENTWRGHENGLRADMVQALADLRPGVFRFPGGCIVEGTELEDRYQWKNSVGPVENRPLNVNRWQYTFADRLFPDYYQSYGLGFYEYFLLSEEIGAEPLPVLNVGMACQYQNKGEGAHAAPDSLGEYIRDAIDLVEFANGDTTTVWGGLRARMGHPEPFGLKYIAIGNEQWGPEYVERLRLFVEALRTAHPEIELIGSAGPKPDGDRFGYLWPEMKKLGVDLVDEHYYCNEEWFLGNATRYDSYDRRGPKVFAGEYACHGDGKGFNHFNAALCEAAFMTGLERNADVVWMATYAPLFAHVEGWQWRPDMIWFDNLGICRTSSYNVQWLFSRNKGECVLALTSGGRPVAGEDGLYASAVRDGNACVVKVVNASGEPRELRLAVRKGKKPVKVGGVHVSSLSADSGMEYAEEGAGLRSHSHVVESEAEVSYGSDGALELGDIPASTVAVYRLEMR